MYSRYYLKEKLYHYQVLSICLAAALIVLSGAFLIAYAANGRLEAQLKGTQEEAIKDYIIRENEETLARCSEDADSCHVEFIYNYDGELVRGEVVGEARNK